LAFVSAVKGSMQCPLRTRDFNVKSEVAARIVKAVTSASVRTHVAMVGHEADNRDIQRTKRIGGVFSISPNTLITPPQITDQVTSRRPTHGDFKKIFLGGAMVCDMKSIDEWGSSLGEYLLSRVTRVLSSIRPGFVRRSAATWNVLKNNKKKNWMTHQQSGNRRASGGRKDSWP